MPTQVQVCLIQRLARLFQLTFAGVFICHCPKIDRFDPDFFKKIIVIKFSDLKQNTRVVVVPNN